MLVTNATKGLPAVLPFASRRCTATAKLWREVTATLPKSTASRGETFGDCCADDLITIIQNMAPVNFHRGRTMMLEKDKLLAIVYKARAPGMNLRLGSNILPVS
jgi:hypothetical protein